MKKPFLLLVLLPLIVVAQPSSGPYPATPGTITAAGPVNASAIRQALTNVSAGGTVLVYPGHYFISNNNPIVIPTGKTLQGIGNGVIFEVDTNGPQAGRLDYSTFQAMDNSTIRNITWLGT